MYYLLTKTYIVLFMNSESSSMMKSSVRYEKHKVCDGNDVYGVDIDDEEEDC